MIKKVFFTIFSFFIFLISFSQDTTSAKGAAGALAADRKIYVVMAVVITILAGLILYVVRLDRKIGKLERTS
ncbi:MAG TPA: hypothetical protein VM012_10420 [Flavitalea sp.]|nr:hypothetical protein [Flavitalea sp.]